MNPRCGVIELQIDSFYTKFCSYITNTTFDCIGFYYSDANDRNQCYFWDQYTGMKIETRRKCSISDIIKFRDVLQMRIRPFANVTDESFLKFRQFIFHRLTCVEECDFSRLFSNKNSMLPGFEIYKQIENEIELKMLSPTLLRKSSSNDISLFDFSPQVVILNQFCIENPSVIFQHKTKIPDGVQEMIEKISDINREISHSETPYLDWDGVSLCVKKLAQDMNVENFYEYHHEFDKYAILSKNLENDDWNFSRNSPDFSGLSKEELYALIENIQICIEQGNLDLLDFQKKCIDWIAMFPSHIF